MRESERERKEGRERRAEEEGMSQKESAREERVDWGGPELSRRRERE